ncbi:hypothetical protein PanWU01x14_209410 [Parasponia andersonii]|uniref:Uncharacterized protein n=1 Tax=Parasponia andersonii TaxID=3476 RepID=A0A2P5BUE0_PARAD|nr:hypothetical protein PanWU01x14_209410 [Parasponia andersonii]
MTSPWKTLPIRIESIWKLKDQMRMMKIRIRQEDN